MKKSRLLCVLLPALFCGASFAAEPVLDIGNALKSDEEVAGAPVIRAATLEDGMKLAADENQDGVRLIAVPSGTAVTVTGAAPYRTYENLDASLLSQRQAYVRAYLKAQKLLTGYFEKMSVQGTVSVLDSSDDEVTDKRTMTNESVKFVEDIQNMLSAHLDNFIVSAVNDKPGDDGRGGTVTVTLVVSPRVGESCRAVSPGFIDAPSLQEGVVYVMNELTRGVLPPVGGKLVRVPQTGEVAVISFGSEIVIDRRDAEKSKQVARRRADARADSAMVEILRGADVVWKYGMSGTTKEVDETFERVYDEDIFGNRTEKIVELESVRKVFESKTKDSEFYKSVVAGALPAGVQSKFFFSGDGHWCWCVKMYTPSLTLQAQELRETLQNSREPRPKAGRLPAVPAEPQMPGRGPSGKVQDDSLL